MHPYDKFAATESAIHCDVGIVESIIRPMIECKIYTPLKIGCSLLHEFVPRFFVFNTRTLKKLSLVSSISDNKIGWQTIQKKKLNLIRFNSRRLV